MIQLNFSICGDARQDNPVLHQLLETFQKLLAQTGIKTPPEHTVIAGNVVLSREEFNKLVSQMKPPSGDDTDLPFEYLITKAIYSGKWRRKIPNLLGPFTSIC
jgi:hypothetical protein